MLFVGSTVGIIGGLFAQRYVSALLFQVSAADPTVVSSVGAALASVSVVALLPAILRALRIDPAVTLRAD